MTWESIAERTAPASLDVAFPNVADVTAPFTLRFSVLVPHNVSRGPITLKRVRGDHFVMWAESVLDTGIIDIPLPMNIQLVPIQNNEIALDAVLDPRNAIDMESNRIIWRRTFYPDFSVVGIGGVAGFPVAGVPFLQHRGPIELDIKSQRRFDRSEWALISAVSYSTIEEVRVHYGVTQRALFVSPDGL